MKLAIDATIIKPPLTGVQYSVKYALSALLPLLTMHEVTLFTADEELHKIALKNSIQLGKVPKNVHLPTQRILWQQTTFSQSLNNHFDHLLAMAYTAPLRIKIPYSLFVHDIIALTHPEKCSFFNIKQMKALMPRSLKNATNIIVSSDFVATQIKKRFAYSAKLSKIPLGVSSHFFESDAIQIPQYIGNKPFLLFVGTIEPKKGIETLIDSYQQFAKYHDINLVIAGKKGWKCTELVKKIQKYNGPGKIIWQGYLDASLIKTLYQQAEFFIFPSSEEGFGLPVLEAMAANCPVIHSDHPALMETAGDAGLVFSVGNSNELYQKMHDLISSKDLQNTLRTKGLRQAQKMTWEAWAKKILRFYT